MDTVNIRIFDKNINFLGEVDNYTSLFYIRKWSTFGEFEFHISKNNRELFKKGNIIMLGKDGYKAGVIEYVEDNEEENKDIIVKGFGLLYYLSLRITVPGTGVAYDTYNTNIETIMYNLVDKNAINATDTNRKIQLLENATNKNKGGNLNFQTRYKSLDEELFKLSNTSGLGINIRLDYKNKKLIFEVIEGINRSYYQSVNPTCIFSKKYDNITKRNYIESDIGYKNVGYVAGQGEGADRELVVVNNTFSGIDRRETFIDARDIPEGGNMSLADRGKVKLAENTQVKTFECEVNTRDYKKSWDLGDTVTIKDEELGITQDYRVVEVKEIYEKTGNKVETVFGVTIPTLVDKVRQMNDSPVSEASGGIKDFSITVNGATYKQNNGNVTLPNYPTDADTLDGKHASDFEKVGIYPLLNNVDMNNYDRPGAVGVTNGNCKNSPTGGNYWYIQNLCYWGLGSQVKQIAWEYNGGRLYSRFRYDGTWSDWVQH